MIFAVKKKRLNVLYGIDYLVQLYTGFIVDILCNNGLHLKNNNKKNKNQVLPQKTYLKTNY